MAVYQVTTVHRIVADSDVEAVNLMVKYNSNYQEYLVCKLEGTVEVTSVKAEKLEDK